MFRLIKKLFIELLTSIVSASNHTKCVSLRNQKCKIQPTLVNLHLNESSQEFHCYPFSVKLDRCVGSCNTLNDLSNKVCIPKKNRRFKSKRFQHDCRYKWIENTNKKYFMQM